jgi:hypothetical protein
MEIIFSSGYTHVEVEPNDNTPMIAQQVYKNLGLPFSVSHVRIYNGVPGGRLCSIVGWTSAAGGPLTRAYAVKVDDSSAGSAFLVYGGDWGVRLRPADSDAPWSIEDPDQWGETQLLLPDESDLQRG